MNMHSISLKRLLGFWLLAFLTGYSSSFFLFTLLYIIEHPIIYMVMLASTPVCYLFFGWLYFRKIVENDWSMRFFVCAVWIGLTMISNAILMMPMYGYPWTLAFTTAAFQVQLINVAAVLLSGWVGKR